MQTLASYKYSLKILQTQHQIQNLGWFKYKLGITHCVKASKGLKTNKKCKGRGHFTNTPTQTKTMRILDWIGPWKVVIIGLPGCFSHHRLYICFVSQSQTWLLLEQINSVSKKKLLGKDFMPTSIPPVKSWGVREPLEMKDKRVFFSLHKIWIFDNFYRKQNKIVTKIVYVQPKIYPPQ